MNSMNDNSKGKTAISLLTTIYKVIAILAPFGFLLSIAFFLIQTKRSENLVNNLTHIEQSLSTRHIGIFPDYLDKINLLLSETPMDTTKVVIFVDVLFYGAFYNGESFKEMILQQQQLASKGKKIVIAYYNNKLDSSSGRRQFREVVQTSWMQRQDFTKLTIDRRELMNELRSKGNDVRDGVRRNNNFLIADSIVSEKYFAIYRDNNKKVFDKRIKEVLKPLYDDHANDFPIFKKIDEIKNTFLNKPSGDIRFHDIYTMYQQITDLLIHFYEDNRVKLIPLDDYLTMCCWSNGERVLFAFPGKFAADEIGFISSDGAILHYIETMLEGVENSLELGDYK